MCRMTGPIMRGTEVDDECAVGYNRCNATTKALMTGTLRERRSKRRKRKMSEKKSGLPT